MYFKADSECVEVVEVENFEFCHDWFGVCSWWVVFEEPHDFLLGFDEWLDVGFPRVVRAPNGDIANEVRVDHAVVEAAHDAGWKEFVGVFEAVDCGL